MRRRDLLLGSIATAFAAAWSRVSGAVGVVLPAPPPALTRFLSAGDILDRMYRDLYRRLIDDHAFDDAFGKAIEILRASNEGHIDQEEAAARMSDLHLGALLSPPVPQEFPPLPPGQVGNRGGDSVAAARDLRQAPRRSRAAWPTLFRCYGDFQIDDWRLPRSNGREASNTWTAPWLPTDASVPTIRGGPARAIPSTT
jgi:hypothetical protein